MPTRILSEPDAEFYDCTDSETQSSGNLPFQRLSALDVLGAMGNVVA